MIPRKMAPKFGSFSVFDGITQELLYMVDTGRIANYRKAVAILKSQIIGSQQTDITTEHTAHIHTIAVRI